MKKSSEGQRKRAARITEPRVGIFWLVDGKLLIDSTLLSAAEEYEDFKIYSGNNFHQISSELQEVLIRKAIPSLIYALHLAPVARLHAHIALTIIYSSMDQHHQELA